MRADNLKTFFLRELNKLSAELRLFPDEESLWKPGNNIANSAGNLAVHIIGNLNHFIGSVLGNSGYVRDRDLEFSVRLVPLNQILESIENTKTMITEVAGTLADEDLEKIYPVEKSFGKVSTEFMLMHLLAHLCYHLGQINYYRRMNQG